LKEQNRAPEPGNLAAFDVRAANHSIRRRCRSFRNSDPYTTGC
jgi:hypothetical protein